MSSYHIIYKGSIDIGQQNQKILLDLSNRLKKIDLPWDSEIVFSTENDYGMLSFCALLEGKEIKIQEALTVVIEAFPRSHGSVFCYGDNPFDIRRLIVLDARIYEQKAEVEYEEPGRVIFVRIP